MNIQNYSAARAIPLDCPSTTADTMSASSPYCDALSTISIASQIDLKDGRRIWCPPSGRPYWVGGWNAGPDLTDKEIMDFFGIDWKESQ